MKIVWDERKRAINLQTHRLDFAVASTHFDFELAVLTPTHPGRDGRARFKAIGQLDGDLIALVFSPLGSEAIALISLRRASRTERKLYEQSQ